MSDVLPGQAGLLGVVDALDVVQPRRSRGSTESRLLRQECQMGLMDQTSGRDVNKLLARLL